MMDIELIFYGENGADLIATVDYEGAQITAAVQKVNLTGFQFHPEKIGDVGLDILRAFLKV